MAPTVHIQAQAACVCIAIGESDNKRSRTSLPTIHANLAVRSDSVEASNHRPSGGIRSPLNGGPTAPNAPLCLVTDWCRLRCRRCGRQRADHKCTRNKVHNQGLSVGMEGWFHGVPKGSKTGMVVHVLTGPWWIAVTSQSDRDNSRALPSPGCPGTSAGAALRADRGSHSSSDRILLATDHAPVTSGRPSFGLLPPRSRDFSPALENP